MAPTQRDLQKIRCDALHVGMPKCGSTFLQHIGFATHSGISLVWEPDLQLFHELRDQVDMPSFDLSDYACRLGQYVTDRTTHLDERVKVVFSFEGFCGPQTTNKNDRLLAEKLRELVGETKVIFIIRDQYKLLFSIWTQFIKEGGTLSLRDFLTSPKSPAAPDNPKENIFLRVQYDHYVESLFELFGRENVGIFLFEDFVSSYETFMVNLYSFIGVDCQKIPANTVVWRGPNMLNAEIFRMLNMISTTKRNSGPLPYRFYLWYRRCFQRHVFSSKRWNRSSNCDVRKFLPIKIQEQIRSSNQNLAKLTGYDLSKRGYSMK